MGSAILAPAASEWLGELPWARPRTRVRAGVSASVAGGGHRAGTGGEDGCHTGTVNVLSACASARAGVGVRAQGRASALSAQVK